MEVGLCTQQQNKYILVLTNKLYALNRFRASLSFPSYNDEEAEDLTKKLHENVAISQLAHASDLNEGKKSLSIANLVWRSSDIATASLVIAAFRFVEGFPIRLTSASITKQAFSHRVEDSRS